MEGCTQEIPPVSTMTSDAGMCMLLIDVTLGPTQLRTYYLNITVGSGVTQGIFDNLYMHSIASNWYFGSISSDDFSGLVSANDDNAQELAKEYAHFFETQRTPDNCLGNGLDKYPDMSRITHVVHYISRSV